MSLYIGARRVNLPPALIKIARRKGCTVTFQALLSTLHLETPATDAGRGYIDKIDQSGSRLHIQGWVAEYGSGEPADYVQILISGNQARKVVHEPQMRVDVNEHLGMPGDVRRGFRHYLRPA